MVDKIRAFNAWAHGNLVLLEEFVSSAVMLFLFVFLVVFLLVVLVCFLVCVSSSVYSWAYRRFHLNEHPDAWAIRFCNGFRYVGVEYLSNDSDPEEYAVERMKQRDIGEGGYAVIYRMYNRQTVHLRDVKK